VIPATARPTILGSSSSASMSNAAVFLEVDKPKPVVLFELVKGWLTGGRVEPGETHELRQPHR
jgi:hypothetical protein